MQTKELHVNSSQKMFEISPLSRAFTHALRFETASPLSDSCSCGPALSIAEQAELADVCAHCARLNYAEINPEQSASKIVEKYFNRCRNYVEN